MSPHDSRPPRGGLLARAPRGRSIALGAASLLALLAFVPVDRAQTAEQEEPRERRFRGDVIQIFTGDVEIPAGTVRDGTVVCIGGSVTIRGEVTQDVVVILGALALDGGDVGGNVVGVLSDLELRDTDVEGDLVNVLGRMSQSNLFVGSKLFDFGVLSGWFPRILKVLTWLRALGLLIVFLLLVLLVALAPERVRRIGQETPVRYVSALFTGLLVYLVLLIFVFPLALGTVIGLPFLVLTYLVVKWLGLAGMFHAVGQRIARVFGGEISPLGAVLLVFAGYAAMLLALSPFGAAGLAAILLFHMAFFFFFEAPALGLIVLTRMGTRVARPPSPPAAWAAPATSPAAPAPAGTDAPPAEPG